MNRKIIVCLVGILTFLFVIPSVGAVAYTWNGIGGICFDPTQWFPMTGGVPTLPGDTVAFTAMSNAPPLSCGISNYDSETLAASYGSLVRHTANLLLLNGGLAVDNAQWTIDGGRSAIMGQFSTACSTACPILQAKITLEPASYLQAGGEPLNCTVGANTLLSVEHLASLNCTTGMYVGTGASVASDGIITITSPLDLHGEINCGFMSPSSCTFETLRGTGILLNNQPTTLISIQNTDYSGFINFIGADFTHTSNFISTGTTTLQGGVSAFLTIADFDKAFISTGAIINVSGAYLNFSGDTDIASSSILSVLSGVIEFNNVSNITDSSLNAGQIELNSFSNITNSTLIASSVTVSSAIEIHNSTINTDVFTSTAGGDWVELNLQTPSASIIGGTGLNITDSFLNILGNAEFGTSAPQYQLNVDPTIINISGNFTVTANSTVNLIDSILNVGENVFIEQGALLNLTNSVLNVTGNISLVDNSSWLNLTGGNDPLGGSFIEYCYYGLGTPNIHDVGGSVHNFAQGYNQFRSDCFGLNITYPLQSSVYTTSPIFFQVVLFGENATLQTPPSTWELYRMAAPQWLMNSGNFSNYTWAHWQSFNGVATGWHKLIASTNMTVPGAIPLHVIRDFNNSFHRGEVTFYWNGTPIAPSNATTVNVNITQSIGINESDSTYAQAIVIGIIGTSAIFAYLAVQVSAPALSMLYLGLFHLALVIGVAAMLKIGEAFITANLLSTIEPFYTLSIFALIFIVFYILITFIINSWRSITESRVRGPVDD
jgi:hypothetical protein